ncbi:MAG: hypothetical protein QOG15_344 [Solirubrobacteraceae bacterium]|jgi:hypothetical protein|nr:hypothetical protein [Solirubrobacteraceae bacterium]
MLMPHKVLIVVGGVLASSLVAEAVLGWGLHVKAAWVTVFIAALILGVLAAADAAQGDPGDVSDEPYNLGFVAATVVAIVGAVACLYLPMPYGGLAAVGVILSLILGLRVASGGF